MEKLIFNFNLFFILFFNFFLFFLFYFDSK